MSSKKPTLEEVKDHFKDALEVECVYDGSIYDIFRIDNVVDDELGFYSDDAKGDGEGDNRVYLYYKDQLAKITKYKDKQKEPEKPKRYKSREVNGMDVIDLCKYWDLDFNEGNILKYLLRDKGEDISDMEKISDYANRQKEYLITKNK